MNHEGEAVDPPRVSGGIDHARVHSLGADDFEQVIVADGVALAPQRSENDGFQHIGSHHLLQNLGSCIDDHIHPRSFRKATRSV
jgi:hypothetical protein